MLMQANEADWELVGEEIAAIPSLDSELDFVRTKPKGCARYAKNRQISEADKVYQGT